jgi:hypothetical protein
MREQYLNDPLVNLLSNENLPLDHMFEQEAKRECLSIYLNMTFLVFCTKIIKGGTKEQIFGKNLCNLLILLFFYS